MDTTFHACRPASEERMQEVVQTKANPLAGGGRILVMDDEEFIRDVAAAFLMHLGYSAVVCCDGAEAVELYRRAIAARRPFAAVIMDLTIPKGMGGQETMKKLLELDQQVIGIVSSGYCQDPILLNYQDYGFSGIVEKPYSLAVLAKVLHELLSSRRHNPVEAGPAC